MSKKNLVTSIAASMVLASVLVLSGCGGSSAAKKSGPDGIKSGGNAEVTLKLTVDPKTGKTTSGGKSEIKDDRDSSTTGTCIVDNCKNAAGQPADCTTAKPCEVKCQQQAPACSSSSPGKIPVLRYTQNYGDAVLDYAWLNKEALNYDPTKQMIIYGGALLLTSADIASCDVTLNIKGLSCGIDSRTGTDNHGFTNDKHKVFAMVQVLDANNNTVGDPVWTEVVSMDEKGNFTLNLKGINLAGGKKAEVLLFSIKDANVPGSTGVSGAGS